MDGSAPGIEGAFVAIEARSGDVLAWVGGRDFTQSRFDRAKNARRQAGSAFKPFVYAAALRKGHLLTERLADRPITVQLASTAAWQPQNFDRQFSGVVTLRDALVFSKNVPTIELADDVGLRRVAGVASDAGITSDMDLTPAMPLGTVAVSPLELASAYIPFATLGNTVAPRFVLAARNKEGDVIWEAPDPAPREVLDPAIAYLVTDVLRDAIDRGSGVAVRTSGFSGPAAGKTGTTNSATDAWFIGYTPAIVAAVWIGHDQPRSIGANASGGRLAAPVWARIMLRSRGADAESWTKPDDVIERWVDADTGHALKEGCRSASGAGYREIFVRGHVAPESCPQRGELFAAQRRTWAAAEEEDLGDEWPSEIAGRSLPAPSSDYEEAELPRRKMKDKDRDDRKAENETAREEKKKEEEKKREEKKKEDEKKKEERKKDKEKKKEGKDKDKKKG